jgi:hypothetical protein
MIFQYHSLSASTTLSPPPALKSPMTGGADSEKQLTAAISLDENHVTDDGVSSSSDQGLRHE